MTASPAETLRKTLTRYVAWLERYGETSQDHQDFFASKPGRAAKALYYRSPLLGKMAVAPMILCEAFLPWTRPAFYPRMRLPISDAHFAMGFALLYELTGEARYRERMAHFLEVLESTRCPGFANHGWGYPFDWQTRGGAIPQGTPLITTVPYCYEAFEYAARCDPANPRWLATLASIARHARQDYGDVRWGDDAATCTYTPTAGEKVVNASAYRAFTLFSAWNQFGDESNREVARRNLNFVLQCQQPDGSWPYAVDGVRDFVDHFHTCFVLKALVKIEKLAPRPDLTAAIERGIAYYTANLFDQDGLPKPFSKAPRLTVYKRELYDCAEAINLGTLLRGRFTGLDARIDKTVAHITSAWVQSSGAFRSRKLMLGWDNVPMHRWGGSEMFRALALHLNLLEGRSLPPYPQMRGSQSSAGSTPQSGETSQRSGVSGQKADPSHG